jgi:hypothetical protein
MMKSIITGLFLAAFAAGTAHAARIDVDFCKDRSDTKCSTLIAITGEITAGDADRFERLVKTEKIERAGVILNSPGGLLYEAVIIGLSIHERGFVTYVGDNGFCTSACADIWLAGRIRYVAEDARIGFHRAGLLNKKTGKYDRTTKDGDKFAETYFRRLGLTEAAIRFLRSAKPGDDMVWLTGDVADQLGIIATSFKPQQKEADKDASNGRCQDGNGKSIVCNGEAQQRSSVKTQNCAPTAELDSFGNVVTRNKCL